MPTSIWRPHSKSPAQLQIPSVTDDYRAILANDAIEAVLICSSTHTHARFTKEAAEAGKHIFCEKPIAHSLAEIDEALAAVAKAGVKLQVGFNRRFDANFRRVRCAVETGEIGHQRSCTSSAVTQGRRPCPTSRSPAACSWI